MRTIDKPNEIPKDVYLTCISRVRNNDLKGRLEAVADIVSESAEEYDQNGINGRLFILVEQDNVAGIVTKDEMEKIYTTRMAKIGKPGRPTYDKLKASAPDGICPICGHRTVSTLDHFLPKASFPTLVVTPFNLVPACSDCNKLKFTGVARTAEEQTLHPYYDDVTTVQWLFAEVVEDTPVSIRFFVQGEDSLDDVLKARIQKHFNTFKLGSLYASQSGTELANIRFQLNAIFEKAGGDKVQEHLAEAYQTRRYNHVNSWQTAMYQALARSAWFFNGGFKID